MAVVRYFAAARAAAGRPEEPVPASTLDELVAALGELHGEPLTRLLKCCSYLVDGVVRHDPAAPLADTSTVDVLPPFAGG
ncbi:MAG: MoaD/ThiS family protein [Micromonosporaceae bacterium]|nr:MoaD/ThiS family protein [Micromonosporaceae bacterium]